MQDDNSATQSEEYKSMRRFKRTLMGLAAVLMLGLGLTPTAFSHGNLAHERVQLNPSQLVYQSGDSFEFTMDAFPISASNAYTWYIYIVRNETGERLYYPDFSNTPHDILGYTAGTLGSYAVPWINNFQMLGTSSWPAAGAPGALTVGTDAAVTSPGMYSLVVELRDSNGFMLLYTSQTKFVIVNSITTVSGNITVDTQWTNDNAYLLQGAVFVQSPATLTIERGTVIEGESSSIGTLVVAQGGRIVAEGTEASPIIMTSDQPAGSKGRGQWGGLILNGQAPINVAGGVGVGEGGTGNYGGGTNPDPNDDSGILRYVRVEYAGREFSVDNELNGIAFQGVGNGTQVDHIQVHYNQDDGVEFFGGTVNVKYVLLTGNRDDGFDWTEGFTGKAQFVIVLQVGDEADRGIEADNNADDNTSLPRSHPTIYNFSLIGDPDLIEGVESTEGMKLREGTSGYFRNFIVTGFKILGIDVDVVDPSLSLDHGIVKGNGQAGNPLNPEVNFENPDALPYTGTLLQVNPLLIDPFDVKYPDYRSVLYSQVYDGANIEIPPDDGFFSTDVWFLGGVDPLDDWTLGWTSTHVDD
jgi:hypothetical protein